MSNTFPIQFISLGPGDPELITLKAYKQLQESEIIFCPSTRKSDGSELSRSKAILKALELSDEQIRTFHLPMSKNRKLAFEAYHEVYLRSVDFHKAGKRVSIVAEGDVGFYSSIHSILDKLSEEQIPVTQIAGIPAFIASGASAGLHIVQQEERLMVVPGIITHQELSQYLQSGIVIVIMKLSQCQGEVNRLLTDHPEYDYYYFENVGTDQHYHTTDLKEIKDRKYPYFSLMIIRPNHRS